MCSTASDQAALLGMFIPLFLGRHSTSTNLQVFELEWMKTKHKRVCVFCSQSEAPGGVSGPEGKHPGEACWLRLPQSFQEVPQQVNDSLHLHAAACVAPSYCTGTNFHLVFQEKIGGVLFRNITWNLMWEKMSEYETHTKSNCVILLPK